MILSSTRSANHARVESAGDSAGQLLNRVFERHRAPGPDGLTDRELRRDLNSAEHAELGRLYDDGTISQATRQQLQRGLDLEAARLSEPR